MTPAEYQPSPLPAGLKEASYSCSETSPRACIPATPVAKMQQQKTRLTLTFSIKSPANSALLQVWSGHTACAFPCLVFLQAQPSSLPLHNLGLIRTTIVRGLAALPSLKMIQQTFPPSPLPDHPPNHDELNHSRH